ncbi:MAG: hypothetical protein AABY93_08495 [Bacteroidota bacterium]
MKKKKLKPGKKKEKQPPLKPDENKDDRFDYGGLPVRDLKKNLACLENQRTYRKVSY